MTNAKIDNAARALETGTDVREDYLNYAQNRPPQRSTGKYFLSCDEKMLRIQDVIEQIANANVPVLVSGESGVGKPQSVCSG